MSFWSISISDDFMTFLTFAYGPGDALTFSGFHPNNELADPLPIEGSVAELEVSAFEQLCG